MHNLTLPDRWPWLPILADGPVELDNLTSSFHLFQHTADRGIVDAKLLSTHRFDRSGLGERPLRSADLVADQERMVLSRQPVR